MLGPGERVTYCSENDIIPVANAEGRLGSCGPRLDDRQPYIQFHKKLESIETRFQYTTYTASYYEGHVKIDV
jgi:predicted subunit of tRNA(5-methylaminomethyl-2-thiouridylate) methyltransferase